MTTKPLRSALTANFIFSSFCALALLHSGSAIGQRMSEKIPVWWLTLLGIGLLGFAALIGFVLFRLRHGGSLLISVMDILWVLSTLPLLAIPNFLTPEGKLIVSIVAGFVGLFGCLQLYGIRRRMMANTDDPEVFRHCIVLESSATPGRLWEAIRDLGSISRYSSSLRSSVVLGESDAKVGAVRTCQNHHGHQWSEEVTALDDKSYSLVLRFRTEAEDFPFPYESMIGGWSLKPNSQHGTSVKVWWEIRPKHRHLGWLIIALMTLPLDRDMRKVVAAMEEGGLPRVAKRSKRLPSLGYC